MRTQNDFKFTPEEVELVPAEQNDVPRVLLSAQTSETRAKIEAASGHAASSWSVIRSSAKA